MDCRTVAVVLAVALVGCGTEQTNCATDADCAAGTTCRYGICGAFSPFPPASCANAVGTVHPYDYAELDRVLPGCWLSCKLGTPMSSPPWPADAIGFAFSNDTSQWWFITDGGGGTLAPLKGFDQGGVLDIIWPSSNPGDILQLNLLTSSSGGFTLLPELHNGPPLQLVDRASGGERWVHVDGPCGGDGAAAADMGSSAPFGGRCDPNTLRATDCASPIGGIACSFCSLWVCEQPCHLGGNDCAAPKSCTSIAQTLLTISGDCGGFDGICT